MKYLLSTGRTTEKIETYIIDLFRLNVSIWPGDIPNSTAGFDFILTNTKKDELESEVRIRMNALVSNIKSQFEKGILIEVGDIDIIDEERVRATISVNQESENIIINLYDKI
jgi:predicted YcjX-like family ATPase